jgi:hypothetical protein
VALRQRQRGWVGLVVILLALAIVALDARPALNQYVLIDEPAKPRPAAAGTSETEQAAAMTPRNALERAKGVEEMVKQGAAAQQKNIDDAIAK